MGHYLLWEQLELPVPALLNTDYELSDALLDTGLTSKAAEMILAFLLSTDPTALKFLSRISA